MIDQKAPILPAELVGDELMVYAITELGAVIRLLNDPNFPDVLEVWS